MLRLAALAAITLSAPLAAKDSLGVFSDWGAFRDPSVPRCYAIAIPSPSSASRELEPFATIGTWPGRNLRGQVHFRLSRQLSANGSITLSVGGKSFGLTGGDVFGAAAGGDDAPSFRLQATRCIKADPRRGTGDQNGFSHVSSGDSG